MKPAVARIILVKDGQSATIDLIDGGAVLWATRMTPAQAADMLRPLLESYLLQHPQIIMGSTTVNAT